MQTDSDVKKAVLRELRWDVRVDATDVGVEVGDGVVTLTGTVETWATRLAAEQAAHRVKNVLDVANDIRVPLPGIKVRSDTDIARALRNVLEWDVFVPDSKIQSTVSDGWVTLEGEVDSLIQKDDTERAIQNLAGVRGVTDNIRVKPPTVAASKVREAIEKALERQAEREASRIRLKVIDGEVRLDGVVHSWAEREAAVGAAKGTPGVRRVDSHLRIEPYAM